jgi:hypothetical protein
MARRLDICVMYGMIYGEKKNKGRNFLDEGAWHDVKHLMPCWKLNDSRKKR